MQDTQDYLHGLNVDLNHCHLESFSCTKRIDPKTVKSQAVKISFPDLAMNLTTNKGELLAGILEKSNVPIVLACRSGVCEACKCQVVEGSVSMLNQSVLTESNIKQGYILACSSRAGG